MVQKVRAAKTSSQTSAMSIEGGSVTVKISKVASTSQGKIALKKVGKIREITRGRKAPQAG